MAGSSKAAQLMRKLRGLQRQRAERLFDEGGEGAQQFSGDALKEALTSPNPLAILDPAVFSKLVSREQNPERRTILQRARDVKPHLGQLSTTPMIEWMSTRPGVGHVVGHEGRARSKAFQDYGLEEYPVQFLATDDLMTSVDFANSYADDLDQLIKRRDSLGLTETQLAEIQDIIRRGGPSFDELLTERLRGIPEQWLGEDQAEMTKRTRKIPRDRFFAKGGQVELAYDVDPKTGRLIKTLKQKPKEYRTSPLKGFNLGPLSEAAELIAQESDPLIIDRLGVRGGPGALDALSALDLPFRALGEAAFEATGSPAAGVAAYTLPGTVSPRNVANVGRKAARVVKEKAPEVVRGALESLGAFGDVMDPRMFAVKPRGGQWLPGTVEKRVDDLHFMDAQEGALEEAFSNAVDDVWANPDEYPELAGLDPNSNEMVDAVTEIAARNAKMDVTADDPITGWMNKNLTRWIKTSMGTEETDALARELGMELPGPRSTMSGVPATTAFDSPIERRPVGNIVGARGSLKKKGVRDIPVEPWMAKLAAEAPDTPIYELYRDLPDEFRGMADYMRAHVDTEDPLGIPGSKLKNISVPDMLRRSKAWHDEMAAKRSLEAINAGSNVVLREYPEGFKWVEIVKPDPATLTPEQLAGWTQEDIIQGVHPNVPGAAGGRYSVRVKGPGNREILGERPDEMRRQVAAELLRQGLLAESEMMGHCVGKDSSYCDAILRGTGRILSLRDAKGMPHATVEVQAGHRYPPKEPGMAADYTTLPLKAEIAEQVGATPVGHIKQIKGKENRAPVERYQQYVQDLIRRPLDVPWGNVRELENAGLIGHSGQYWTRDQLARAAQEFGGLDRSAEQLADTWFRQGSARDRGPAVERARQVLLDEFMEGGGELNLPEGFDITGYAGGGKILKEGAEVARSLLNKIKEKAGAFGDIMDPAMYAVKERGGQWVPAEHPVSMEKRIEQLDPAHQLTGAVSGDMILYNYPGPKGERIWREYLAGGGQDLHGFMLKNYPEEYGHITGLTPSLKARSEYMKKNLQRWAKTSMGTAETDELARELGLEFGQPRTAFGGGVAENPFDVPIGGWSAGKYIQDADKNKLRTASEMVANNPWMRNLPPDTPVHSMPGSFPPEFSQMDDFMAMAMAPGADPQWALRPDQLKSVSVPDMLRKSKAWHDAIAAKKTEEALKAGTTKLLRDYPEQGMAWHEIVAPEQIPEGYQFRMTGRPGGGEWHDAVDSSGNVIGGQHFESREEAEQAVRRHLLKQGLDAEGQMMGHCVGREGSPYCDAVLSGRGRILSLRDKTGRPHVTVEVENARPVTQPEMDVVDDLIGLNSPFEAEALARLGDEAPPIEWIKDVAAHHPEEGRRRVAESMLRGYAQRPASIRQIKGKENAAPVERYRSFAQDLVSNPPFEGGWESVNDLHNVDMTRFLQPHRFELMGGRGELQPGYYTRDSFLQGLIDQGIPEESARDILGQYFRTGREYFAEGGQVSGLDPDAVTFLAEWDQQRAAA